MTTPAPLYTADELALSRDRAPIHDADVDAVLDLYRTLRREVGGDVDIARDVTSAALLDGWRPERLAATLAAFARRAALEAER